eukprot:595018-Pyramimonas_sp.AAC.1
MVQQPERGVVAESRINVGAGVGIATRASVSVRTRVVVGTGARVNEAPVGTDSDREWKSVIF